MNKRQAKKLKQRTVYIALTKQIFCIRTWRDVKLEKRYYKECDKQDGRRDAYTKSPKFLPSIGEYLES